MVRIDPHLANICSLRSVITLMPFVGSLNRLFPERGAQPFFPFADLGAEKVRIDEGEQDGELLPLGSAQRPSQGLPPPTLPPTLPAFPPPPAQTAHARRIERFRGYHRTRDVIFFDFLPCGFAFEAAPFPTTVTAADLGGDAF